MSHATTPRILARTAVTAAGCLVLAGCTNTPVASSPTPAASGPVLDPVASSTPSGSPSSDEAVIVVQDYLSAVQDERFVDAFALLTPESQALVGSAQQLASTAGVVRPEEAIGFLGTDGVIASGAGPTGDSTLVTAVRDRLADAWLVRNTTEGLRIDDAGVPPTGGTPYEWVNPPIGPEEADRAAAFDVGSPASITFTDLSQDAGVEGPGLVGYPEQLFAYLGVSEVEAEAASADTQRRWDMALDAAQLGADTTPLTVVWEVEPGTNQWRTSTAAVRVE